MSRKFWTVALAFLVIVSLAVVADAQRNANPNRKKPGTLGLSGNQGNGNQGQTAGNDHPQPTPDGETPAEEGTCDDLKNYTPGLYGLCIAFCEAHDCVPDFSAANPFENCKKNDWKILDKYNRKKQDGDPDMPCLPEQNENPGEVTCPCWGEAELAAFPNWDPGCEFFDNDVGGDCVEHIYNVYDIGEEENNETGDTTEVQYWLTAKEDDGCNEGKTCIYWYECYGDDCPPDFSSGFVYPDAGISDAEYEVCVQQMQEMQASFGLNCN